MPGRHLAERATADHTATDSDAVQLSPTGAPLPRAFWGSSGRHLHTVVPVQPGIAPVSRKPQHPPPSAMQPSLQPLLRRQHVRPGGHAPGRWRVAGVRIVSSDSSRPREPQAGLARRLATSGHSGRGTCAEEPRASTSEARSDAPSARDRTRSTVPRCSSTAYKARGTRISPDTLSMTCGSSRQVDACNRVPRCFSMCHPVRSTRRQVRHRMGPCNKEGGQTVPLSLLVPLVRRSRPRQLPPAGRRPCASREARNATDRRPRRGRTGCR